MKFPLTIFGLLALAGCPTKPEPMNAEKTGVHVEEHLLQEAVLYENTILHEFSSPVEKDSFKIQLTGRSINEGEVSFEIKSKHGHIILDETFPATYLLDYGLKANPTEEETADYIKERIDKFFDESNFINPAISRQDSFDADYSEKQIWEEVLADTTSVGFYYLVGEEDGRHITYSKRLRKAVVYFNCC